MVEVMFCLVLFAAGVTLAWAAINDSRIAAPKHAESRER